MTKPLSTKREQQIRNLPKQINHNAWSAAYDAGQAIRDLVAELDRLRSHPQMQPAADAQTAYAAGWADGRRHLAEQMRQLANNGPEGEPT